MLCGPAPHSAHSRPAACCSAPPTAAVLSATPPTAATSVPPPSRRLPGAAVCPSALPQPRAGLGLALHPSGCSRPPPTTPVVTCAGQLGTGAGEARGPAVECSAVHKLVCMCPIAGSSPLTHPDLTRLQLAGASMSALPAARYSVMAAAWPACRMLLATKPAQPSPTEATSSQERIKYSGAGGRCRLPQEFPSQHRAIRMESCQSGLLRGLGLACTSCSPIKGTPLLHVHPLPCSRQADLIAVPGA